MVIPRFPSYEGLYVKLTKLRTDHRYITGYIPSDFVILSDQWRKVDYLCDDGAFCIEGYHWVFGEDQAADYQIRQKKRQTLENTKK